MKRNFPRLLAAGAWIAAGSLAFAVQAATPAQATEPAHADAHAASSAAEAQEHSHAHGHGHEPGFSAAHTVTSAYGWRPDPIEGARRFHAGTDVRAAYGQPILAATEGVVTFAGERSGYGLVVTVDHGNGLETRYAHLSAASVKAGTRVGAGEVIAQAGASGRATGPHLHFEVWQDGRPVDPQRFIRAGRG